MTNRFITPDGALDELAWAEMCMAASSAAARVCGQSDSLYRERFSNTVEGHLLALPQAYRSIATSLADVHGDYTPPEQLREVQDLNADNSFCSHGIELNCCPAGCGDIEAEMNFDPDALDHLWEMYDAALQAQGRELADSVHAGLTAAITVLRAQGLDCQLVDLPAGPADVLRVELALVPAGAPRGLAPFTLAVVADFACNFAVSTSLALLDAAGSPFTPSEQPISGLEWADELVASFRRSADAQVAQMLPRNPMLRWARGLAEQVLRIARPSDLTADRAMARRS